MTTQRIRHIAALLGSLATAVLPAYLDPAQTWPARVALTIVTGLLLFVRTDQLATYRNAILGGLGVAVAIVAGVAGHYTAGSAGLAIGGFVLAVLAQLRVVLAQQLGPSTPASEAVTQPVVIPLPPKDPPKAA